MGRLHGKFMSRKGKSLQEMNKMAKDNSIFKRWLHSSEGHKGIALDEYREYLSNFNS